jgi:putative spermidine/putrescine transport system substrate-binding protein
MVALMNEGGFDLVTASGDASLRLVAGDRVQPINTDLIPSWSTVDDRLKDAPWHTSTACITACPTCGGRTS